MPIKIEGRIAPRLWTLQKINAMRMKNIWVPSTKHLLQIAMEEIHSKYSQVNIKVKQVGIVSGQYVHGTNIHGASPWVPCTIFFSTNKLALGQKYVHLQALHSRITFLDWLNKMINLDDIYYLLCNLQPFIILVFTFMSWA